MRRHLPLILLLIPVGLLATYVGSYFWAVEPGRVWFEHGGHDTVPYYSFRRRDPHSDSLQKFYSPMEWLDRRMRPYTWSKEPGTGRVLMSPPSS
jgi:hypothetical protein